MTRHSVTPPCLVLSRLVDSRAVKSPSEPARCSLPAGRAALVRLAAELADQFKPAAFEEGCRRWRSAAESGDDDVDAVGDVDARVVVCVCGTSTACPRAIDEEFVEDPNRVSDIDDSIVVRIAAL